MVQITILTQDGKATAVDAAPGTRLLDIVQTAGLPMEGTCGGAMACSTCHVVLGEADFDRFPTPSEEEDDLLDITRGVSETSRLACQLVITDAHEGLKVMLPAEVRSLLF
ncbi:MAG: 2Fe-2S iron-sulfur cluster-binding protein [Pseudomonadota bacterium]